MANNFMQISHNDRYYVINKDDSLKTLLTQEELLKLPLSVWKELFELKDGVCYFRLMLQVLEAVIKAYDKSSNVNSFTYNREEYWLDKATRVGLRNLVDSNPEEMSIVLGDKIIEMPVDNAKDFLSQLEVYAGKCFITTAKHLQAIKELRTVEDVVNYDYTSGYPDKITLNE